MARINVACPCCCLHEVVKFGVSSTGKQRFQCKNNACEKNTFLLDYTHNARAPGVKDKIVDMAMNGSGVRDTARVLRISIRCEPWRGEADGEYSAAAADF
ncbi:IS1-like element transposase [Candidiatus Paracoxiella cheracis]|uniref:IS1-like element transposase n=1 Tax=Candidiatus Paracoxiella cheracis TaxID=3405120 RepID=UPI003BF60D32